MMDAGNHVNSFFTGVDVQPVEMKRAFSQCTATEFDEMVVVGKKKYLGALGQRRQLRENSGGPVIVEGYQ